MNKGFGHAVVRLRIPILIVAVLLLIPSVFGYLNTRTNYDILTYLPKEIETMKGQEILANDFGTGAFSMVVVEGMNEKDIKVMAQRMEEVPHVRKVIWYGSLMDISIPEELLPSKYGKMLKNGDARLMIAIFDTTGVSNARRSAGLADNISVIREVDNWRDRLRLLPRLYFVYFMCRIKGK